MARLFMVLALLFKFLALNVKAGHPAWETSRVATPQWLAFEDFPQGPRFWPDKTIRYAFANDEARTLLGGLTRQAHDIWLAVGLPSEFKIQEITVAECDRAPEICLKIYRSPWELRTTVGTRRTPYEENRNYPTATWTENPDVGFFEPVSNIAHELGHSWGLTHEHQSRFYHEPGNGILDFWCERLADYDRIVQANQLTWQQIWDPKEGLCTDALTASGYRFSGFNWLPWTGYRLYYSEHATRPSVHDVDWDSIMIYPSYLGAQNPQDDHDFNRAIMLKAQTILPEDRWIPRNLVPSTRDLEGLKTLYGHRWPVPVPVLLGNWESPHRKAFKQIAPGCYSR